MCAVGAFGAAAVRPAIGGGVPSSAPTRRLTPDEKAPSRPAIARDEASIVRLLPHGQPRTRRPPGLKHVRVRARVRAHPLKEIKNQVVDGVFHS